jgi:hypothetical protein
LDYFFIEKKENEFENNPRISYENNNKLTQVWLNIRLKSFGPLLNGLKNLGSGCILNPLELGEEIRPKSIGS